MKDLIKKIAAELGFCASGVTTADPLDELSRLVGAIAQGRIADMAWLARNPSGRCDPRSLLPSAKSVICLAYPYGEDGIIPHSGEINGLSPRKRVARFARGAEYHAFIKERLELFWNEIAVFCPEAGHKCCVDTSPIMEKGLAARAGLGWIGKNTLLMNEKFGSWILLGEIITDIEISPDAPAVDLCGDCDLCLRSCPTGALVGPRVLDAGRCLSYLTIESKGDIPSQYAALAEGRYGCDLCQECCHYPGR